MNLVFNRLGMDGKVLKVYSYLIGPNLYSLMMFSFKICGLDATICRSFRSDQIRSAKRKYLESTRFSCSKSLLCFFLMIQEIQLDQRWNGLIDFLSLFNKTWRKNWTELRLCMLLRTSSGEHPRGERTIKTLFLCIYHPLIGLSTNGNARFLLSIPC